MKTNKTNMKPMALAAMILSLAGNALSETLYVLPGDRIQSTVDQAEAGDTVVVLAGEYLHDVSITKNIKLKKAFGETVTLTGDLTVSGLTEPFEINGIILQGDTNDGTAALFKQCKEITLANLPEGTRGITCTDIESVTVTGTKKSSGMTINGTTKKITISNTTESGSLNVYDCEDFDLANCTIGGALLIQNSTSKVTGTTTSGMDLRGNSNSAIVTRCKISNLNMRDSSDDKGYVFFQNSILEAQQHNNAYVNILFSYNKFRYIKFNSGHGEVRLVGNVIDGFYNGPDSDPQTDKSHKNELLFWNMANNSNSKFYAYNNVFRNIWRNSSDQVGIRLDESRDATVKIYNNIFDNIRTNYDHGQWYRGRAITHQEGRIPALFEVKGNVFHNIRTNPVWAQYDNADIKNNYRSVTQAGWGWHNGGWGQSDTNIDGNVEEDFIDFANGDFRLADGSKCLNAGPDKPWFMDRDGTVNDMGLFGGPKYDPDGFTTDNPVVLSSEQEPLQFFKGKTETISISAQGIVAP